MKSLVQSLAPWEVPGEISCVRAHEHDLDALVMQGKRRRLELQGDEALGPEEWDLTPTATGSASLETLGASSGGSSPKEASEASFGGSEASSGGLASWRAPVATPRSAAAPPRLRSVC